MEGRSILTFGSVARLASWVLGGEAMLTVLATIGAIFLILGGGSCMYPAALGWESCRHVGDMSPQQPNVGTFGRHPPVVATQSQYRHIIFVSGIADIHPICILVPELHTENSFVTFGGNIWLISVQPWYFLAPLNA